MSVDDQVNGPSFPQHQIPRWDFDELARGYARPEVIRRLRRAERSRRLLLLRALDERLTKDPTLVGPLTPPEEVWDLLARAEQVAPNARDLLLAHPYTGAWAGYVIRLLRDKIAGVCPQWMHVGHLHALAAAMAVRAGIPFSVRIPVWDGGAVLPTIGMARLSTDEPYSVAEVRGDRDQLEISAGPSVVRVARNGATDTAGWWDMRTVRARAHGLDLAVRLDDLDPYRGLYEPVRPQRLGRFEVDSWRQVLGEAWELLGRCLPDLAAGFSTGLDSLVPRPAVPLRNPSASTGEAFGSAIIAKPADAASLAATLVHEFQHNLLGGVLHMIPLYEHDPEERFYTLWRDDPRPISGVLSGIHAFFGVTAFWRALARQEPGPAGRRARFEFGYWRAGAWRTLRSLSGDARLTQEGQRFLDGIADRLGPWTAEPLPADVTELTAAATADHLAGWRIRYLRPVPATVLAYAEAWLSGQQWPSGAEPDRQQLPTPVPDGSWSGARIDLVRTGLITGEPLSRAAVPDATSADLAYLAGDVELALAGYRAELAEDPDRPDSWVGLGLTLATREPGSAGARALLECPELVRAVHRALRGGAGTPPRPDELADWVGRSVC